jgi:hypothetical protein
MDGNLLEPLLSPKASSPPLSLPVGSLTSEEQVMVILSSVSPLSNVRKWSILRSLEGRMRALAKGVKFGARPKLSKEREGNGRGQWGQVLK